MIKIFKTNVSRQQDADDIILILQRKYAGSKVTFDLDDCDKVLRVEGASLSSEGIMCELVKRMFLCAELD